MTCKPKSKNAYETLNIRDYQCKQSSLHYEERHHERDTTAAIAGGGSAKFHGMASLKSQPAKRTAPG